MFSKASCKLAWPRIAILSQLTFKDESGWTSVGFAYFFEIREILTCPKYTSAIFLRGAHSWHDPWHRFCKDFLALLAEVTRATNRVSLDSGIVVSPRLFLFHDWILPKMIRLCFFTPCLKRNVVAKVISVLKIWRWVMAHAFCQHILSTRKQMKSFRLMTLKTGSSPLMMGGCHDSHCAIFYCLLPTVFAHLPTGQTIEPATVSFSGQWTRFPLLLRSNADAFPIRGKAISTQAPQKQFQNLTTTRRWKSHGRKQNYHRDWKICWRTTTRSGSNAKVTAWQNTGNQKERYSLDFHDVAVWCLKDALQEAYEAGLQSKS